MLELAWQSVRRTPAPFAAAAGSTALAVVLMLVAGGVYLGLLDAIIGYMRTLPGDLVVAEAGASMNLLHSSSRLPRGSAEAVARVTGVAAVHPLYGRLGRVEAHGREALGLMVGLYTTDPIGGPVRILEGRDRPRIDEIILEQVMARDLGVAVGDRVRLGEASLRVSGIASGGNAVLASYVFVHRGVLMAAGIFDPSYLFVRRGAGVDATALEQQITALPGLQVFDRASFLRKNQELVRQLVLPVIALLLAVAAAIGGAVVALALYAATAGQRTELALLRALGVPPSRLYGVALLETGLAIAAGVAGGLAGGYALVTLLATWEPRFVILIPVWLGGTVAAGAALVGLAAAAVPVRTVARVDPALVFRT